MSVMVKGCLFWVSVGCFPYQEPVLGIFSLHLYSSKLLLLSRSLDGDAHIVFFHFYCLIRFIYQRVYTRKAALLSPFFWLKSNAANELGMKTIQNAQMVYFFGQFPTFCFLKNDFKHCRKRIGANIM
jgi:hypothetical protein